MSSNSRAFPFALLILASACGRDLSHGMTLSSSAFAAGASGTHRYSQRVYALDVPSLEPSPSTKERFEAAVKTHVLAVAELIGTYQR